MFLPLTFCKKEHPSRFSTQFEEQIWRPIRDCCLTLTDHHKGRRTLYQISKHLASLDTHGFAYATNQDSSVSTGKSAITKAERKFKLRGEAAPWRKDFVLPACVLELMTPEKIAMFKRAVLKDEFSDTSGWHSMLAGDWVFHTSTARGTAYSPVEPIGGGEWSAAVAKSCRRDRKVRYVVVPPGTGVGIASRVCTDNVTAQINESVLAPLVRTKTTPLRVVEAAAMCSAYRAKYGVGTQVARPAVSAMTLHPSRRTGDPGLLAELWEHVRVLGDLTIDELEQALGELVPEEHTVVGVTESDQAAAVAQQAAAEEEQEEEEEEEEQEEEESGEEGVEEDQDEEDAIEEDEQPVEGEEQLSDEDDGWDVELA